MDIQKRRNNLMVQGLEINSCPEGELKKPRRKQKNKKYQKNRK